MIKWYGVAVITKAKIGMKAALKKSCLMVERDAKQLCPVDTGRLRSSITNEIEGEVGRVGTNVEYAKFVELGTNKMSPQPYLRPALHKNEKKILALFKGLI